LSASRGLNNSNPAEKPKPPEMGLSGKELLPAAVQIHGNQLTTAYRRVVASRAVL
jgi:hypothetical protein